MAAHGELETPTVGGLLGTAVHSGAISLVSGTEEDLAHLPKHLARIRLSGGDRAGGVTGECGDRGGLCAVTADVPDHQTPSAIRQREDVVEITPHVERAVAGMERRAHLQPLDLGHLRGEE